MTATQSNIAGKGGAVRGRLIKGFLAQAYGRLVMMGGQVLMVPVFITRWGAAGYGEWVALSALALYINYANVGVPGAVKADMALAYGEGGHDRMRRSFQTCLTLMVVLGGLAATAFIAAIHFLPFRYILKPQYMTLGEAATVATVFAVQIGLTLVIGVLEASLSSVGRYGLSDFISSNRQVVEFTLMLLAVGILGWRPGSACLIYLATTGIHLIVLAIAVLRAAPWVWRGPWTFQGSVLRRLSHPMLGVLASSFGYYGMIVQAPRIMLGAVLGPTAVATFAVTAMLMRIVRMPIDVVAHSPTVELSLAHGEGDGERARVLLGNAMRVSFWIAIVLIPVVLVVGPTIVHLWTRGKVEAPLGLLLLCSISTAVFSLGLPSQEALMSRGRLGDVTVWLAAAGLPFLVLMWSLVHLMGINGAALAVLGLDLAFAALALRRSTQLFGISRDLLVALLARPPIDLIRSEAAALIRPLRRRLMA